MTEYYDAEAGAIVKCMVRDVPGQPTLLVCDACGTTFTVGPNSPRHRADTCPGCGGKSVRSTVLNERTTAMTVDEAREACRHAYAAEFAKRR